MYQSIGQKSLLRKQLEYIEDHTSAHVLLNLLDELRKSQSMRGLPTILLLFRNEFNDFDNTGARMLYAIYHITLK